jgi:acyl carrier protein
MAPSTDKLVEQRIRQAIIRALSIPAPGASAPLQMGSTPGWDSMGHMMVVMELEREFDTRFLPYQLPELVDVPSIAKMLVQPGVGSK